MKIKKAGIILAALLMLTGSVHVLAASKNTEDKVKEGISIDTTDISGMSYDEAKDTVKALAKQKSAVKVSLKINKDVVETTLGRLGYQWSNKNVVDEAISLGKSGSVIKRYKDDLDLKNQGKKYALEMKLDQERLQKSLEKICKSYNVKAQNASLKPTGHGFQIIPEKEGCEVDYAVTVQKLYDYVEKTWDKKSDFDFETVTKVSKPKYTTKDCEKVSNEPMGSFSTTFTTGPSYDNRNKNIRNGVEKIDGNILYPGESFSCNEHLVPWTQANGWYPAGTYVDGGVADSLGGGICQVSSTLYNALLRAEIKITKRFSHSMAVSYVDLAADAALAGDYKDLIFENNTDAPIYIQGVYTEGTLTFRIYGHDTRAKGHKVEYKSELISTTPIKTETKKDPSKPKGYTDTTPGHVGYVAKLWKITYENGKQVEKELLHTSTYAMSPQKVVKGTGETDKKKPKDKKDEEQTTKKSEKETEKVTKAPEKATKTSKKKKTQE